MFRGLELPDQLRRRDSVAPIPQHKTRSTCLEEEQAVKLLHSATVLRSVYQTTPPPSEKLQAACAAGPTSIRHRLGTTGVLELYDGRSGDVLARVDTTVATFAENYHQLVAIVANCHARTWAHQRLELLGNKYELQVLEHGELDTREMGRDGMASVDFFDVAKVDNHIHLAAAFHAPCFSDFVREKLEEEGDTVVLHDSGGAKTLSQVRSRLRSLPSPYLRQRARCHVKRTTD